MYPIIKFHIIQLHTGNKLQYIVHNLMYTVDATVQVLTHNPVTNVHSKKISRKLEICITAKNSNYKSLYLRSNLFEVDLSRENNVHSRRRSRLTPPLNKRCTLLLERCTERQHFVYVKVEVVTCLLTTKVAPLALYGTKAPSLQRLSPNRVPQKISPSRSRTQRR